MFEKLGYKEIENNSERIIYELKESHEDFELENEWENAYYIQFYFEQKNVIKYLIRSDFPNNPFPITISIDELKCINEKINELGWIK